MRDFIGILFLMVESNCIMICGDCWGCSCTLTGHIWGWSSCHVCESNYSIVSNPVCVIPYNNVWAQWRVLNWVKLSDVLRILIPTLSMWSDRQVVQPTVTVPMPGATHAAPPFGMRRAYNEYLSVPAGSVTSAYGRGYTPAGTFRYDSRVGAGGSNRRFWDYLDITDVELLTPVCAWPLQFWRAA